MVLGGFGSFWVVLGGFGWFRVLVTTCLQKRFISFFTGIERCREF